MTISGKTKVLALVPKGTGLLSLCGSLFIMQDVLWKQKRTSVFHRIMLGLSIFDCMSSVVNVLSTWPTPAFLDDTVYLASGSVATCTAQGFLNEVGNITTVLYTACLTLRYLLFVCYGMKEHQLKRYEIAFHGVPVSVGLLMGIVGLPLQLYNNSGWLCWYAPFPAGCTAEDGNCTRGALAPTFRWIHYALVWTAIVFITVAMLAIYWTVRKQEVRSLEISGLVTDKSDKWHSIGEAYISRNSCTLDVSSQVDSMASPAPATPAAQLHKQQTPHKRIKRTYQRSRDVAAQAGYYILALYATWLFTTITRLIQNFGGQFYPSVLLMAIFFPLQGFWNCCIYVRPRLIAKQRKQEQADLRKSKMLKISLERHQFSSVEELRQGAILEGTEVRTDPQLSHGTSPPFSDEEEPSNEIVGATERQCPAATTT